MNFLLDLQARRNYLQVTSLFLDFHEDQKAQNGCDFSILTSAFDFFQLRRATINPDTGTSMFNTSTLTTHLCYITQFLKFARKINVEADLNGLLHRVRSWASSSTTKIVQTAAFKNGGSQHDRRCFFLVFYCTGKFFIIDFFKSANFPKRKAWRCLQRPSHFLLQSTSSDSIVNIRSTTNSICSL